jgi:hypothetical protein
VKPLNRRDRAAAPSFEPTLHEIIEAIASSDASEIGSHDTGDSSSSQAARALLSDSACVLCSLVSAAVVQGIKLLFSEFVNDPHSRLRIRASRGFCREHTRIIASRGDALGVSILYEDLADQTIKRWRRGTVGVAHRNTRFTSSTRAARCPACDLELEAEARYAGALAAGLDSEQVWSALTSRACLCVPHVENVAEYARRECGEQLLALESEKLKILELELEEIVRKHDYRFRNEEWGEERDAWLRALTYLIKP